MSHTTARCPAMSQCPEKTRLLNRKDERLDPQEQGVHEPDGIHPVQNQTLCGAHVRGGGQELVVAAVGVDDGNTRDDPPELPSRPSPRHEVSDAPTAGAG